MQAEILSLDSLDDLDRALATFSTRAAEAVTAMRAELLHRQADLDGQEEDARAEVSNQVEALQLAEDDDERESCACSLSEAREQLSRIRGWQARVREEHAAFLTQAALFDRLLDQALPRNREFLRTRIGELRAYGAVQPEPDSSAAAYGSVSVQAGEVSPPSPMKLTDHCLPDRFVWVPLAEISEAELAGVATKDAYKKVEYDKMATGLRRLAAEILPRIQADPDRIGSDAFYSLDKASGEGIENGLQQIYDAFFHKEYVYLERRKGQDKFEVTNGCHRIRVALDLGWDAIPARVKDLRS
jgi:hypothetical protein